MDEQELQHLLADLDSRPAGANGPCGDDGLDCCQRCCSCKACDSESPAIEEAEAKAKSRGPNVWRVQIFVQHGLTGAPA